MGDVSIIARRLEGGTRVQYGWSGNGGYYKVVGNRLLCWYDDPKLVEYLFGLGQMKFIGKPESEKGGESWMFTNVPDGMPHWLGKSEREIFSQIAFIDYGYFYDLDNRWYYIIPGPFRIKVPLEYIAQHLDEQYYEFEERDRIRKIVAEHILGEVYDSDADLQAVVSETYSESIEEIRSKVLADDDPCYYLWDHFKKIYDCLDDWVLVKTDSEMENITGIVVKRKQGENRVETIDW